MTEISIRTLHIICPGLRHSAGHDLAYTLGIAGAARQVGLAVRIHHPGAPEISSDSAEWQSWPMPAEPRGAGLQTRVMRKARETMRRSSYASIFRSMQPQDVAFAHTVGFREAFLLASASPGKRFALLQRYDHYDDPQAIAAFQATAKLARKHAIALLTDSIDLAAEFGRISGMHLHTLPPPSPGRQPKPRTSRATFGFLGAGRIQKGFMRLPDIVQAVRARVPEADFLVQCYVHPDDADRESIAQVRQTLGSMEGVRLVDTVTSDQQYADLLDQCSVVLTPYDAGTYRLVTSRVFVEGLAAGAAVMTTPDTWMAHEAARFDLERAFLVDFQNPASIGSAAVAAVASVRTPAPNTTGWLADHSFDRLAHELLGALV